MTIADNLQSLIDAKADMKSAIESKGVEVTGGLSTYADAIRGIDGSNVNALKVISGVSFAGSDIRDRHIIFDCKDVKSLNYMFSNTKFTTIELINTDSVTSTCYMFTIGGVVSDVVEMPLFDTSNVTNMEYMFYSGSAKKIVPLYNTVNVKTMAHMFDDCHIKEIPQFDTRNVVNMITAFASSYIEKIPALECGNVEELSSVLANTRSLTDFGGFKNLGKKSSLYMTGFEFSGASALTYDSIINILEGLYDRHSDGYSTLTLKFHKNAISKLSDEDIMIATSKGWIVSQ